MINDQIRRLLRRKIEPKKKFHENRACMAYVIGNSAEVPKRVQTIGLAEEKA
jgi:hypothetical protein